MVGGMIWYSVNSRAVAAIGYDYVTGALGVQFHQNPKAYILANVPYSLFTQFLNASSHGAFWNRYLRGKFR